MKHITDIMNLNNDIIDQLGYVLYARYCHDSIGHYY